MSKYDHKSTTLREVLEAHPEWADLPVGIYQPDGDMHFLGGLGSVYLTDYTEEELRDITEADGEPPINPFVTFAGN